MKEGQQSQLFCENVSQLPQGKGGSASAKLSQLDGGGQPYLGHIPIMTVFFNTPLSYFNLNIYLTYKSLFLLLISIFFQVDGPVVHSSNVHLFSKLKITMTTGKSEPFMNMYFFFFCGR